METIFNHIETILAMAMITLGAALVIFSAYAIIHSIMPDDDEPAE